MKTLRSVSRMSFNVGTAGWFTVLRPNTWFSASRLSGSFREFSGQSKGNSSLVLPGSVAEGLEAALKTAPTLADRQETGVPLRSMELSLGDHRFIRMALIALAAAAVTLLLLWWMIPAVDYYA